jgi:CHASE2 domain-containing sensor protein
MKIFSIDHLLSTVFVFMVLIFLPIVFNLDFLDPIQNTIEDFYVTDMVFSRVRDNAKIDIDTNIVLVNIGNLNRKGIARQIMIINEYKPLAIGIDAFFKDEKSPEIDTPLMKAFFDTENLILVSDLKKTDSTKTNFDTLHTSHEKFRRLAETGFANFVINKGDFRTVRKFSPREYVGDSLELSFPVKIASILFPNRTKKFLSRNNELEIINYRRNINKYRTLDASEVLEQRIDLSFIQGKVVLMGFIGPKIGDIVREDIFFTPMNEQFVGKSYPDMYGVVVHANIVSMIGEEDYLTSLPVWVNYLITLLIVFFLMALFTFVRERYTDWYEPVSVILIFAVLFIIFWIVIGLFHLFGLELMLREAFFAITISGMGYEGYQDSMKPLSISFYQRIKKRLIRK